MRGQSIYLVHGELALVSNHSPQAGHRAEQRNSQSHAQIPLSFCAKDQNHTERPATRKHTSATLTQHVICDVQKATKEECH